MAQTKELGFTKPSFYFQYRGEVNTTKVLELACDRARELNIREKTELTPFPVSGREPGFRNVARRT
ncbi:hypothetical protein M1N92_05010, partial [Dehalococcoidia bacterium]|nr:hypothetical protein [Dehalococcoidia bacterium]